MNEDQSAGLSKDVDPTIIETTKFAPAGFWIRAAALTIDGIVITYLPVVLLLFIMKTIGVTRGYSYLLSILIMIITNCIYFTYLTGRYGQTVGKMLMGVKVIRDDGSEVSFGRALGRWFSYILSSITLYIGYFMAGWNREKKALHDYVVDTKVIRIKRISGLVILFANIGGIIITLLANDLRRYIETRIWDKPPLFKGLMYPGFQRVIGIPSGFKSYFQKSMRKANEGQMKAIISSYRSALSNYFSEHEKYPAKLEDLVPKYRYKISSTRDITYHPTTNDVLIISKADQKLTDIGAWAYDPKNGKVYVNCTHTDSRNESISDW